MKKRIFIFVLSVITMCSQALLSGCSNKTKGDVVMRVWCAAGDYNFTKELVKEFIEYKKEVEPDVTYSISTLPKGENEVLGQLQKADESNADVFSFVHDQLGKMVEAGVILKNLIYKENTIAENSEMSVTAATYNNTLYGFPYASETSFLYYDSSVFSADDVKSIETMISVAASKSTPSKTIAPLGLEMNNAYYSSMFFIGAGVTLYGDNGENSAVTTLNSDAGLAAANYINGLKSKGVAGWDLDKRNEMGKSGFSAGTLGACISGLWDAADFKNILGSKYAVAELPEFTAGGTKYSLKPFAGIKMFGVKANTKYPLEAQQLAQYISSRSAQRSRYENNSYIPTSKTLIEDTALFAGNTDAQICLSQTEKAYLTPKLPQMALYWKPFATFTYSLYNGLTGDNTIQSALTKISGDVISQ